ncbi:NTP transferase domain-containing protein [bacterium]|nr:NTP transferase domain-containing protein [bacterium]MBU1984536.1 NTP transferase domain-containing protein [bacterium]
MNVAIIVAARMDSKRLPGKALLPFHGVPMIVFLLRRLRSSRRATDIVLATTSRPQDDVLEKWAEREGIAVFRGAENDLVARYAAAAEQFAADYVVRVTGDCPFVDGALVDECLEQSLKYTPFDLATTKGCFPVGLDCEIYPARVMVALNRRRDLTPEHREHLTLHLYEHSDDFKILRLRPPLSLSGVNATFTVDTMDDYHRAMILLKSHTLENTCMEEINS